MYVRFYKFASIILKIESKVELEETEKTEMFLVSGDEYDYKVLVSLTSEVIKDFLGCAVCERNANEFDVRLNENKYSKISVLKVLSFLPMYDMLFEHDMFVLHSSFIKYGENAILFSGDSGVGKTTQALLWEEYSNAEVINGDRTLIVKENDDYYANGFFLSGTSGICKNDSCKLKTIVFLQHGIDNKLRKLGGLEAFKCLMSQSSYSIDNQSHIEQLTDILADMVKHIPVYHYMCRKDESAVNRLKESLYGK